jgi:hypothetical protein
MQGGAVVVCCLLVLTALASCGLPSSPKIPKIYPLYKQCDPKWGKDVIVHETICEVGCLMSSISMSLAGNGITINGSRANPGSLNKWLQEHNGYDNSDDLEEDVCCRLVGHCMIAKTLLYVLTQCAFNL